MANRDCDRNSLHLGPQKESPLGDVGHGEVPTASNVDWRGADATQAVQTSVDNSDLPFSKRLQIDA